MDDPFTLVFGPVEALRDERLDQLTKLFTELRDRLEDEKARRRRVRPSVEALPSREDFDAKYPPQSLWMSDADLAEIAKSVRATIAKEPRLSGVKCAVRIKRYSMGQSIDCTIVGVPPHVDLAPPRVEEGTPGYAIRRHSESLRCLVDCLESILAAHNRVRGEGLMSHTFHAHVSVDVKA